ncbi:hypothetical protein SK128_028036 [Halocaridina rubra]|uniref:Secreted protein n=1 Tax=Halocaridina rubra TaxID=373956 RepID=A0AAN8X7N8_HALRR
MLTSTVATGIILSVIIMTGGKTDETPPKDEVKFSPGSSDAFPESDLLHMKSKEITQHVENHERKISDSHMVKMMNAIITSTVKSTASTAAP